MDLPPDPSAEPDRSAAPQPWLHSDRRLAQLARPVQEFLHIEAAGGAVLVVAALVALVWANSPWQHAYEEIVHTHLSVAVGDHAIDLSLQHWVNDGLMALFFLVVGMEIKTEWVSGELRDRRTAALPALAALGGMVVPALVYLAVNSSGSAARGWGIPMATDIAFALGVLALLGRRVPAPLKIFLLTLAVVDDIGAIVVIAVVYTEAVEWGWLAAAALVTLVVAAVSRSDVRYPPVFVGLGLVLWLCVFESGVHATLAGVVMGLLVPAVPLARQLGPDDVADHLDPDEDISPRQVQEVTFRVREQLAPTTRLSHALHPWAAFVVVPLFAFTNAGIPLYARSITSPQAVSIGVVLGLVLGKPLGIVAFSWIALRTGIGSIPAGIRRSQLVGAGALGGIGFTVSLFVAGLAFPGRPLLTDDAKVGVLLASALAAAFGATILVVSGRDEPEVDQAGPEPGS